MENLSFAPLKALCAMCVPTVMSAVGPWRVQWLTYNHCPRTDKSDWCCLLVWQFLEMKWRNVWGLTYIKEHFAVLSCNPGAFVLSADAVNVLSPPRAAAMTLRTVLLSLQALLSAAEPDDPQDAVVAKQVTGTVI